MSGHNYDLQAARIESVFTAHKVPVRVWQATVSPRFVRFEVTTAMGTRLNKVSGLAEELAYSLGARTTRVYREGGVFHVEVPRETSRGVVLLDMCRKLDEVPADCAILGIDERGDPLSLKIDSPDVAHVLVSGTTGSGKTAALRTLLLSLAMYNHPGQMQLVLMDPKGRGLAPLADLPHVWQGRGVVRDIESAIETLRALIEEMVQRDAAERNRPRIVVGIDELADLLTVGGKAVAEALTRLTQRGREAGIHIVAATQKPAATLIGGLVKANFPVRVVGSVVSPEDAKVAAGIAGSGAEHLLGRGDFLLINKGQTIRFQAAYAAGPQMAEIVAEIRAGGRRRRSWRPEAKAEPATGAPAQIPAPASEESTAGRLLRFPFAGLLGRSSQPDARSQAL